MLLLYWFESKKPEAASDGRDRPRGEHPLVCGSDGLCLRLGESVGIGDELFTCISGESSKGLYGYRVRDEYRKQSLAHMGKELVECRVLSLGFRKADMCLVVHISERAPEEPGIMSVYVSHMSMDRRISYLHSSLFGCLDVSFLCDLVTVSTPCNIRRKTRQ